MKIYLFFLLILCCEVSASEVIAFRGLHQSVLSGINFKDDQCTATFINREDHPFIENTIAGIDAGFTYGATIGHFNLRRTKDNVLVAFHDEDLSCRTNGEGKLSESFYSYLQTLDVGFGYTPDGFDFPARGFGIGELPTLNLILQYFPDRSFVINDKIGDEQMAILLAQALNIYPSERKRNLFYIGQGNDFIRQWIPEIQVVASEAQHLKCFNSIEQKQGIEENCSNLLFAIPFKYICGNINQLKRLLPILRSINSKVWVWDVNRSEDFEKLRDVNLDAIGTYRINKIPGAGNFKSF